MANPKILYNDLSSMTFSSNHDATLYPATNLKDYEPATVWKSTADETGVTLTVDLGSVVSCSMIVVDNHNLGDMAAIADCYAYGADDSGGSNPVTVISDLRVSSSQDTAVYTFSPLGKRYWSISWANDGNPIPSASFGNVFVGSPLEFTTPYDFGYKKENAQYSTTEVVALDGTIRTSQAYAGRILYELKYSVQNDALKTAFQAFVRAVRGKLYPFYFVDTDGVTVRYMHIDDYVPVQVRRYGVNDIAALTMKTHASTY